MEFIQNLKFPLAAAAKSHQLCLTLCDPINGSPPGSPVPGILQARTLEWVAISFSNAWNQCMKVKSESEVAQSCPTLSDPMDCSPPGSSVHGIFQARVLEWVASAFSENSHLEQLKIAVTFIYSVIIQTSSEFSYGTQLLLIAWLNCFAEGGL